MASLTQCKKINQLITEHDWQTTEHPEHKDLDPMDIPIGGPVMMVTPEGKHFLVGSDGSVIPYD